MYCLLMIIINVEDPNFINQIFSHSSFKGKADVSHSRLSHYRVLEAKQIERKEYSDNSEFLYSSGIKIAFIDDLKPNFDRILELINRTNQINYTKLRLSDYQLHDLLQNTAYKCEIIKVKDRFGEYGIVGFYALHLADNRLDHFLFSCRSMNIGVEQFVYSYLNFPEITVLGDVTTQLNIEDTSDWIELIEDWNIIAQSKTDENSIKILLKGACDLSQMMQYVTYDNIKMETEFNHVNENNHPVSKSSTMILMQSLIFSDKLKEDLSRRMPFFDSKIFETEIFKEDYDVLVYSMLTDYTSDLYQSVKTGVIIPYESYSRLENEGKEGFIKRCEENNFKKMDSDFYEEFTQEFLPIGPISPEVLLENLNRLRVKISKPIILINGADQIPKNGSVEDFIKASKRHSQMNRVIDSFCSKYDDVYLLDVRKLLGNKDVNHDLRYYLRHIDEKMAKELVGLLVVLSLSKFNKNIYYYSLNKIARLAYVFFRQIYRKARKIVYFRSKR